uniref:Uncharacterized protein n=1 Tax=Oncorhynchus kisutch TaxID=8019 RepID=A0A8C7GT07_ONCKI
YRKIVFEWIIPLSLGIGLALCERLLSEDGRIQLCLTCRNLRRAQAARYALLTSHPDAQVALLQLDTSSICSVLTVAHDVKLRYNRLDYLYLNAGIMPNPQLDVKAMFHFGCFSFTLQSDSSQTISIGLRLGDF